MGGCSPCSECFRSSLQRFRLPGRKSFSGSCQTAPMQSDIKQKILTFSPYDSRCCQTAPMQSDIKQNETTSTRRLVRFAVLTGGGRFARRPCRSAAWCAVAFVGSSVRRDEAQAPSAQRRFVHSDGETVACRSVAARHTIPWSHLIKPPMR